MNIKSTFHRSFLPPSAWKVLSLTDSFSKLPRLRWDLNLYNATFLFQSKACTVKSLEGKEKGIDLSFGGCMNALQLFPLSVINFLMYFRNFIGHFLRAAFWVLFSKRIDEIGAGRCIDIVTLIFTESLSYQITLLFS